MSLHDKSKKHYFFWRVTTRDRRWPLKQQWEQNKTEELKNDDDKSVSVGVVLTATVLTHVVGVTL